MLVRRGQDARGGRHGHGGSGELRKGSGGFDFPRGHGQDHPGRGQRRFRRRPTGSLLQRSAALHLLRAAAGSAGRRPEGRVRGLGLSGACGSGRSRGIDQVRRARRARPAHHAPVDRASARLQAGRPLGRPGAGDRLQRAGDGFGRRGPGARSGSGGGSRGRCRDEHAPRSRAGACGGPEGRPDVAGRARRIGARPRDGGLSDARRPRRDHSRRRRLVRSERFRPRESAAAGHRPARREERGAPAGDRGEGRRRLPGTRIAVPDLARDGHARRHRPRAPRGLRHRSGRRETRRPGGRGRLGGRDRPVLARGDGGDAGRRSSGSGFRVRP